jgi:formate dehydrogenase subunit gamma
VRNQWIIPYGGALLLIAVAGAGAVLLAQGPAGRPGARHGAGDRALHALRARAHWSNAIAFAVLGISGIVMAFGKFFLLPVLGGTLFGWLTYA